MRSELAYLDDILECIALIESYLDGVDEATFQANHLLQDGVARNLEIIGEATKSLPDAVRQKQPQIDWRDIMRMRDAYARQIDSPLLPNQFANRLGDCHTGIDSTETCSYRTTQRIGYINL